MIVSPGEMVIEIGTDGAGMSSYQAEYEGVPLTQSLFVPICSRPFDDEAPPRPTQKLELLLVRGAQVTVGWTHVPLTSENDCPLAM